MKTFFSVVITLILFAIIGYFGFIFYAKNTVEFKSYQVGDKYIGGSNILARVRGDRVMYLIAIPVTQEINVKCNGDGRILKDTWILPDGTHFEVDPDCYYYIEGKGDMQIAKLDQLSLSDFEYAIQESSHKEAVRMRPENLQGMFMPGTITPEITEDE